MDMNKFMNLPFVQAFLKMIAGFLDFKGRTNRSDFWWAVVACIILSTVLGLIFKLLGGFGSILQLLYSVALLIPGIAIWFRRMHDVGKPGWWCFVPILDIVFAAQEGQPGDNQYGPDPNATMGY